MEFTDFGADRIDTACSNSRSFRSGSNHEPRRHAHRPMSANPSAAAPCWHPGTPLSDVRAGIDACVHCGFCLQACPTYLSLEDENDSPRGRIVLMRALVDGSLPVDDADVRTHIDRCLGCRACETACPSGVP